MKSCGLIVEYNPFHYGHQYHLRQSKLVTGADCMIAVMSGNFLQRGEPAIIDKFHRAKVAIKQGVDIVVELPYAYAVQNSDFFAKGAVLTLGALDVSHICFGSENGDIDAFTKAHQKFEHNKHNFSEQLKSNLTKGLSFPEANRLAYQSIGLTEGRLDLAQPNNILGFSYIKNILEFYPSINPTTIKRMSSHYHDKDINNKIASATSIRKQLLLTRQLSDEVTFATPTDTQLSLNNYLVKAGLWHEWECYFQLLQYRVLTMSPNELQSIHGMDEGFEYRLKQSAQQAVDFASWMDLLKTKRYTHTRIQRILTHVLINSKRHDMEKILKSNQPPYIRLLGMSEIGQAYLSKIKRKINVPLFTSLRKDPLLKLDEQATDAYYSVISPIKRHELKQQELSPPFIRK